MRVTLPVATLILDHNGVPQGVKIDGHLIPAVAEAQVLILPTEITRILIEVEISEVVTERPQQ